MCNVTSGYQAVFTQGKAFEGAEGEAAGYQA